MAGLPLHYQQYPYAWFHNRKVIMMMSKDEWTTAAYYSARRVIAAKHRKGKFLAEKLLRHVVEDIGETADFRAFGPVIQSLKADRLIECAGYAPAISSNYSPKKLWRKVSRWSCK